MTPFDLMPFLIQVWEKTRIKCAVASPDGDRFHLVAHLPQGEVQVFRIFGDDLKHPGIQVFGDNVKVSLTEVVPDVLRIVDIILGPQGRIGWNVYTEGAPCGRRNVVMVPTTNVDLSMLPPWRPLPPGGVA